MEEGISLSELADLIAKGLKKTLEPSYWVVGEISEIQPNRNGHCYLELIEKNEDEPYPEAKMRAVIWANKYRMLAPYFESETGSPLCVGMKILVQVNVTYHALYGLALQISDINPTYTIGEDEQRRLKILRQLEEDGVLNMNKEIELPSVPQRIAVISSATAAGYQDFMQQLANNVDGIKFYTTLFPAAMQGVEVEQSIVAQLDAIAELYTEFDVVVIIRGGGSRSDLRWFDNYKIASYVAQFPLPVITGIGHDKDQSITDIVANTSLKTPTAVAEFLIDLATDFYSQIEDLQDNIHSLASTFVGEENDKLNSFQSNISNNLHISILQVKGRLDLYKQQLLHAHARKVQDELVHCTTSIQKIQNSVDKLFVKQQAKLQVLDNIILNANPEQILKKGYTLTTNLQGEIIRSAAQAQKNDTILTHFADGTITSTIN